MNRRAFLKLSAVGAGATLAGPSLLRAQTPATPKIAIEASPVLLKKKPLIGIQLAMEPLMRPNLNAVFDDLQSRAGVNALFPFIYGNTYRWAELPNVAQKNYRGGNFGIPHMQYYKETNLTYEDLRAPEAGDMDVLERITTEGRKRGIKTFAWILEDNPLPREKWAETYEVDFRGRRASGHPSGRCYNHPFYRAFILGLVEDYSRSYPIDGVMWSSERQGGFLNALGAWAHGEHADPGRATCFCEHCVKRGREQGIDVERAKKGFAELEKFVRAGRAQERPRDGYFVSFFRLLLNYPELLAWERLWIRSRLDFMSAIYTKVKSVNPSLQVGWHIWHTVSFSPFHRAEMDFAEIAKISDYIKPVLYSNCAGERVKSFVDSVGQNVFGDLAPADSLKMLYQMFDYKEAPYDRVFSTGFSADYVRSETRRTVDDVAGTSVEVWPGLDIDVPVPAAASQCTAESVKQTVLAAFQGGASGIVLSRNYSEMKAEHLSGAGAALRELGFL